jgi:hypothetical protein
VFVIPPAFGGVEGIKVREVAFVSLRGPLIVLRLWKSTWEGVSLDDAFAKLSLELAVGNLWGSRGNDADGLLKNFARKICFG